MKKILLLIKNISAHSAFSVKRFLTEKIKKKYIFLYFHAHPTSQITCSLWLFDILEN